MTKNTFSRKGGILHIQNSAKAGFDKFGPLGRSDLQRDEPSISLKTERSMAYRDAYGILFYLSGGDPVQAIGDLRVTRSLIHEGVLTYNVEKNEIGPSADISIVGNSGPVRTAKNGTTYQAVLEGRTS